jgi:pimeloyl-ACP methyl ester carboxylesterase
MGERVGDLVADLLPDAVRQSSYDPVPAPAPPEKAWWGRPFAELRWQAELARLVVDPVYAGRGVPRGDGGPVLLIPGFLAGDASLSVMGSWLRRIGHTPYAAGILANVDCSDRAVDRLERLLLRVHVKTGRQVALVGHSRGGHFAKALAHRRPERVSAVVSMGAGLDTPFDISVPTKGAIAAVRSVHAATDPKMRESGCFTAECKCKFTRDYAGDFPDSVPLTSIYSRGDGVVRWHACVVDYANCVEVTGSHVGLAFNRKSYRAVAEALADAVVARG